LIKTTGKSPKVIFIIPFAMINAGKSHIIQKIPKSLEQTFKGYNISLKSVSIDEIRNQHTLALMDKNKDLSFEEAFSESKLSSN